MTQMIGTIVIDLHGKNRYQARVTLDAALRRAGGSVYRICVIHGYIRGTELREMVRAHYADHPKVLRVEAGENAGQTVLVLRER